jgi:hypothetical protein
MICEVTQSFEWGKMDWSGSWSLVTIFVVLYPPVLRIRIHRIHVFLGLPDPDPLVRAMYPDPDFAVDPDPSIIMQK